MEPPLTAGPEVSRFIETFCRHSKGEVAGQLIKLRQWQRDILNGVFAQSPQGLWLRSTALIMLPRKSAKSQLGSGMALYALVTGGAGAEVYSAAGSRDQARRVFDEAKAMVQMDAALSKQLKVYRNVIEFPKTGSYFKVLSSEAGLQHGLNPSFAVIDETHVHPNGELSEALSSGRGARTQSMIVHITTPGAGENCYLWELLCRVKQAIAEGDDSFYLYWNPPPDGCDHLDPAVWALANPALGDWITEDYLAHEAKSMPENEFRRLQLAQWTSSRDAWLPFGAWLDLPKAEIEAGEKIILAVDGSWSNDSTAIVAATPDGRIDVLQVWEKPKDDPHWRVPMPEVERAILNATKKYKVLEIPCDPAWISALMQRLENDHKLPVTEFNQTANRMIPACQKFYNGVMDGSISHSHNAALARHLDNCRIRSDIRGVWVTKEHKDSPNKIDLAVCAIMAYDRALEYREKRRKFGIYLITE